MTLNANFLDLLGGLLATAVASDIASRRIPNLVVAFIAAAGLVVQWVNGGPSAAALSALASLGVLALLLVPWMSGKLGGGDVKLIAATAIWVGPSRVLPFLALTAAAGAPVAYATRLVHFLGPRCEAPGAPAPGCQPAPPFEVSETVPLATAIALGAYAALHWNWP
jgi:prepilin peptidase CpaA